jgi:predicted AlkP superfamily pyrophosphatase or phosphodiesterase
LDYNLQRLGPAHPEVQTDFRRIDAIVGDLISFFERNGVQVLVLSEYGISPVSQPVHLNRIFRQKGWVAIKEELGLEMLDAGASQAFAVADHQAAHVYVNDPGILAQVRAALESTPGVQTVLAADQKRLMRVDHGRAGDLIAISDERSWFTYYYWLDDARAPDFARCVDIHRKPGYDPVELFVDPSIKFPMMKIGAKLLRKKLGFRMLMDVIPLDATLVKGSHGRVPTDKREFPLLLGAASQISKSEVDSTEVYGIIRSSVLA